MQYNNVIKVLRGVQSVTNHREYTLQYLPNKWTYPFKGKIYAFHDYTDALQWSTDCPHVSIWQAEAEIFKDGKCMMCTNEDPFLCDFWEWYLSHLKGYVSALPPGLSVISSPNGTVLCNMLRITRKLKDL